MMEPRRVAQDSRMLKASVINIEQDRMNFRFSLDELQDPDRCEIKIDRLKVFLKNGSRVMVPLRESYVLKDILAFHGQINREEEKMDVLQPPPRKEDKKYHQVENDIERITRELTKSNENLSIDLKPDSGFFQIDCRLRTQISDIIEDKKSAEFLEKLDERDYEQPDLDIKETCVELIFLNLKLLSEFFMGNDIHVKELISKFFARYFPVHV